jgi:hypothetical protein
VRTIALEEHFWTAGLAAPPGTGPLAAWGPHVGDQLRDLGPLRLARIDATLRADSLGLRPSEYFAGTVIYVTSMLPKVCVRRPIYGTMVL